MGYIIYHLHDEHSNCNGYYDSVTSFKEYIELAKQSNMSALGISNHGNILEWVSKKQACDKAGIKYIHGVETYLCLNKNEKSSFHIGLYAKNYEGVEELNELVSKSTLKDGHFYRVPRIYMDELKNTSDNIIITTACLASLLWKLKDYNESKNFLEFLSENKHRCFLEIQPNLHKDQIEYNQILLKHSIEYGIPLIAGTDTHSSTKYADECRKILQKSRNCFYGDEDSFDLTWKTYDELVEAFKNQNSIPEKYYLKAIDNTNVFNDMIEDFELDYSFKYPDLYNNIIEKFNAAIDREYTKKINRKLILDTKEYDLRLSEEIKAFRKQGMESFIYFMYELCKYCKQENIPFKYRGSVGGSLVAYILDIIDVDPIKLKTVFSRFCNADRISLADIDIDFAPNDREKVFQYIIDRFSTKKTSYIAQFTTLKDRGTFDVIGRGNNMDLNEVKDIKNQYQSIMCDYKKTVEECIDLKNYNVENDIKNHDVLCEIIGDDVDKLNNLRDKYLSLKEKYPDMFYYFDGLKGTVIASGNHPAGMIGSPVNLIKTIGVWYGNGDANMPIATCSMIPIESLNFCKFDILSVKLLAIIKDTYEYINKPYESFETMDIEDENLYKEIPLSKVGCFQFEGEYAFSLLKQFSAKNIYDVTIMTAAIRPSGASYRDKLLSREYNKNPSKEIDELYKDNYGYIVYQEDTIKFLKDFCNLTGSEADTIRRAISKKKRNIINQNLSKIIEGYRITLNKDLDTAKKEIDSFLDILIDSAKYQFGYNHAIGYASNLLKCMYLRHYHPIEFITAYLNNATCHEDYYDGNVLANLKGIKIESVIFRKSYSKYSYDSKNKIIYKGLKSIKDIEKKDIDRKFDIVYKKQYDTFIDVLDEMSKHFNRTTITALIELNYFKEYGNPCYLLNQYKLFIVYKNRKQYNKSHLSKLEMKAIRDIEHKETEKIIRFNGKDLVISLLKYMKSPDYDYLELVKNEYKYYSYCHSILKCKDNLCLALKIEVDNLVRLLVYHLNSGIHKKYILYKKEYYKHQNYDNVHFNPRFKAFDLLQIQSVKETKYGDKIKFQKLN